MGCFSSTPAPPDPTATAQAQIGINQASIADTAQYNQVNQQNPYGTLTYSGQAGSTTDPLTQTTALNPQLQSLLTGQEGISQTLTDAAQSRLTGLAQQPQFTLPTNPNGYLGANGDIATTFNTGGPIQSSVAPSQGVQGQLNTSGVQKIAGPNQFAPEAQQAQNAAYQSETGLLQPGMDQATNQLKSQLAAQGIDQTSPAYQQAMANLQRSQGSTLQQAAAGAVGIGNQEQSTLFGENLSGSQQQLAQAQATGNFANAAAGQQFGQNLQAGTFANTAQQQGFSQNAALAQFQNQAQQQQASQALATGQYNQNLYQQNLQDQITGENQNFNEAAAFLNGSPVSPSSPSFASVPQYQAAQASPNAIGLAGSNYTTQAQAGASTLGSIFGALGSVGAAYAGAPA